MRNPSSAAGRAAKEAELRRLQEAAAALREEIDTPDPGDEEPGEVAETPQEFDRRHGGRPVRDGGFLLYADGAKIELGGFGMRMEPTDDVQRLENRLTYHATSLRETWADYRALYFALVGHGQRFRWPEDRYGPGPADGGAALEQLRAAVVADRDALLRVEAALARRERAGGRPVRLSASERYLLADVDNGLAGDLGRNPAAVEV